MNRKVFLGVVMNMDVLIGKVTRYYDNIGVAVVEIFAQPLESGDTIKISGNDHEFTQLVSSVQMEYKQVSKVDVGETAGIKLDQLAKTGDEIYLVSK